MRFSTALPILFKEFEKNHLNFALVGGLAMYSLGAARTTFDADFLILLSQAEDVGRLMTRLGYKALHQTRDVANYVSDDPDMGQVDFLFAHRPYALSMIQRAKPTSLLGYPVKVIAPEDLIGLKVQSSTNDAQRMPKDNADIEEIARKYSRTLDWDRIGDYYRLFKREKEFRDLKKRSR